MDLVGRVQYKVGLIVSGWWHGPSREILYEELGWESLAYQYFIKRYYSPVPVIMSLPKRNEISLNLRNRNNHNIPLIRTGRYETVYSPFRHSKGNKMILFDLLE